MLNTVCQGVGKNNCVCQWIEVKFSMDISVVWRPAPSTGKLAMKNGASKYRFYIETVTVLVRLGTSRSRSPLVLFYIFDHNSKSLHRTPLI